MYYCYVNIVKNDYSKTKKASEKSEAFK